MSFSGKVTPIEEAPICLSLEDVTEGAVHKVLMVVGDNILLIVVNPQRILDWQFRRRQIHLLNIIIIINYIKLHIFFVAVLLQINCNGYSCVEGVLHFLKF